MTRRRTEEAWSAGKVSYNATAVLSCYKLSLGTLVLSTFLSSMEADMFPSRQPRSPLVLVGAIATAGMLVGGLVAFKKGNQNVSQSLMRARVVFQAREWGNGATQPALISFRRGRL